MKRHTSALTAFATFSMIALMSGSALAQAAGTACPAADDTNFCDFGAACIANPKGGNPAFVCAPEMPALLVPAFLLAGAGYIRHKRKKAAVALKTAEA